MATSSPSARRPTARPEVAAWDLRTAWATWREVVVTWDGGTVRGYVEHVAATSMFALVWDGRHVVHVPLALEPSVLRPHFSMGPGPAPRHRTSRPMPMPGQLALF